MRLTSIPAAVRIAGVAALLAAGCAEVKTEDLTPWFRIKTIHRPSIGGLADSVTTTESYVKAGWGWRKLEDCQGGEVLNRDTVALGCSDGLFGGMSLVHEGDPVPRPACGSLSSTATIPPARNAVDCFDVLAGRAPVVPTQLRFRRVDLSGRTLVTSELSVGEPGRSFLGPLARFYGDDGTPYFVTYADESHDAPACALFALENGALSPVASAPELSTSRCYDQRTWSQLSRRALRDALPREDGGPAGPPSQPEPLEVIVR